MRFSTFSNGSPCPALANQELHLSRALLILKSVSFNTARDNFPLTSDSKDGPTLLKTRWMQVILGG